MSVKLLVGAMLVSEHASAAIHALLGLVEGSAVFGLELLVIAGNGSHCELLLAVSETALGLIAAFGSLNPVLAELSLVLAIWVNLDILLGLLRLHGGHTIPVLLLGRVWVHVVAVERLRLLGSKEGGVWAGLSRSELGRWLESGCCGHKRRGCWLELSS